METIYEVRIVNRDSSEYYLNVEDIEDEYYNTNLYFNVGKYEVEKESEEYKMASINSMLINRQVEEEKEKPLKTEIINDKDIIRHLLNQIKDLKRELEEKEEHIKYLMSGEF